MRSRVHELGRMPMLDLIALYLDLSDADLRGQAIRYGFIPGRDRDQVITAIRGLETRLNFVPARSADSDLGGGLGRPGRFHTKERPGPSVTARGIVSCPVLVPVARAHPRRHRDTRRREHENAQQLS